MGTSNRRLSRMLVGMAVGVVAIIGVAAGVLVRALSSSGAGAVTVCLFGVAAMIIVAVAVGVAAIISLLTVAVIVSALVHADNESLNKKNIARITAIIIAPIKKPFLLFPRGARLDCCGCAARFVCLFRYIGHSRCFPLKQNSS